MNTFTTHPASFPGELAETQTNSAYDAFVHSRLALWAAFVWGLAEATFFFIVPDVLITLLACRALRPALKATGAALCGALLGGSLLFACAAARPDTLHSLLLGVPAINAELVTQVQTQIAAHGLTSLLLGPLKGIPYKIYAVVLGAEGRDYWRFLLVSIPARYLRFLLSALAARGLAWLLQRWTARRVEVELTVLLALWLEFYCFYFNRFGW